MEARGKREPRERIMFRDQIPSESYNKLASCVVVEKVLSTRGREISRHPCNHRTHVTIERGGEPRVSVCARRSRYRAKHGITSGTDNSELNLGAL